jgi:hypothetical protein
MSHAGVLTRHSEAMLHLMDRCVPDGSLRVLVAHAGDGCAQVWQAALPGGSSVVSVEAVPGLEEYLPGRVGDVTDRRWLHGWLGGAWFDVIHDRSGDVALAAHLWPYLAPGGVMICERVGSDVIVDQVGLMLADGGDFPAEEVVRISVYPGAMAVEKRSPRVIPYLDAVTGAVDPLGVGPVWAAEGALRVDQAGGGAAEAQ